MAREWLETNVPSSQDDYYADVIHLMPRESEHFDEDNIWDQIAWAEFALESWQAVIVDDQIVSFNREWVSQQLSEA